METIESPKNDHVAKTETPAKLDIPAKVHLASPTPDGVIKLYEALTGKTCTAKEIAEIRAEFVRLPK